MAGRSVFIALAFLCLMATAPALPQDSARITIVPEKIRIGLFYGGQIVQIRAAAPADCAVVMKISGKSQDLTLMVKGQKGGILWMNVGEVAYHSVPSLWIVRSSRPLGSLCPPHVLKTLGLGYGALAAQVVSEKDDQARVFFGELVKLKQKERLFSIEEDAVQSSPIGLGFQEASTAFFLPPKAQTGSYRVEVFTFKDGQGTLLGAGSFDLEFSSSTAFISNLAAKQGLLFGCLAAAIAIIAGLGTGYIFGGKGETH